jgi:hypothetical protein
VREAGGRLRPAAGDARRGAQYLQVTESVCVRGDAPEKTVSILDAMLREV